MKPRNKATCKRISKSMENILLAEAESEYHRWLDVDAALT